MKKEVQLCIDWLNNQKKIKTINYSRSSYGYKHLVEKWSGQYISNEDFIEALRILGIKHKRANERNYYVALSKIINNELQ